MTPETIFLTRWVDSHEENLPAYEALFGRPADAAPMPSCREWHLGGGVILQVIEAPGRRGETTLAFGVADLDAELARLRAAGLTSPEPTPVEGFATLRHTEVRDAEGVPLGLLDGE